MYTNLMDPLTVPPIGTALAANQYPNAAGYRPRGHVLVVDDELPIAWAVQSLLEDEEFEVSVASNGKEALEAIQSGLQPDVIVLDLMMPSSFR